MPKVSPNKTWEGFLGGWATTALIIWFVGPYFLPIGGWPVAVVAQTPPLAGGGLAVGGGGDNPAAGGLRRRRDHVGDQARPGRQGHQPHHSRPWRCPGPDRQPDLHRAALF